jgi:hypothetical protein
LIVAPHFRDAARPAVRAGRVRGDNCAHSVLG